MAVKNIECVSQNEVEKKSPSHSLHSHRIFGSPEQKKNSLNQVGQLFPLFIQYNLQPFSKTLCMFPYPNISNGSSQKNKQTKKARE